MTEQNVGTPGSAERRARIEELEREIAARRELADELSGKASELSAKREAIAAKRDALLVQKGSTAAAGELDKLDAEERQVERDARQTDLRLIDCNKEIHEHLNQLSPLRVEEATEQRAAEFLQLRERAAEGMLSISGLVESLVVRTGEVERDRLRLCLEFADLGGVEFARGLPQLSVLPRGHVGNTLAARGWRMIPALPCGEMLHYLCVGLLPPEKPIVSGPVDVVDDELAAAPDPAADRSRTDSSDRPRTVLSTLPGTEAE